MLSWVNDPALRHITGTSRTFLNLSNDYLDGAV